MWDMKHLIIGILFAVCAIACAVSHFVFGGENLVGTGFLSGGAGTNFAPIGAVIFAFFSVIFFKNAKR